MTGATTATATTDTDIAAVLGDEAEALLGHRCTGIAARELYLPGPDFLDRVTADSDRSPRVLRSLATLFDHGRLGGTGYLSILPVDQGIEHAAGASFAPNPRYFDPAAIVELAMEGGCNAVASTLGALRSVSRRYAHRIPFVAKINHNELLTLPAMHDQTLFGSVDQAFDLGAVAVGATVYFGSPESRRQITEIAAAFERAHELGLATILWAYLRNDGFKHEGTDHHEDADLTGQANHLAATIGADIVKQKQATGNGGYRAIGFGRTHDRLYGDLVPDHPIDWVRYQVANCFMGRIGLINSGGPSGADDLHQAVRTAVINKRAGGTGLISGRKAFQKPVAEGVALLRAIQDVYLDDGVTIA